MDTREALPGAWSRRPGPAMDPPLPEDENGPSLPQDLGPGSSRSSLPLSDEDGPASDSGQYPPLSRKPATSGTRTRTSASTGDADPKLTAELTAAALGVVVAAIAFAVQLRRGARRRQLREPSNAQLDDMAAPLARIAGRHLPVEVLNKDLVDGLIFAGAAGRYLRDGDLLVEDLVDAGIPADLQEDFQ